METSRVQLALNVSDIETATRFYTDMFGVGPAKQRAGYVNFEIADPPLKLALFEHPQATSPLNHLGVEVRTTSDVVAAAQRFAAAGLAHRMTPGAGDRRRFGIDFGCRGVECRDYGWRHRRRHARDQCTGPG